MAGPNSQLKPVLTTAAALVIGISLAWIGWSRGRDRSLAEKAQATAQSTRRIVSGGSMAPTLLGPSRIARCDVCGLRWVVDQAASNLSPDRLLCSHCGGPLVLRDPDDPNRSGADIVEIQALDAEQQVRRGELIAFNREGSEPFIKRVVGLNGDTVDVDSGGMHLLVNGKRVEDLLFHQSNVKSLPRFLVDRDPSRAVSRWASDQGQWTRVQQERWVRGDDNDSTWLVYSHQSVYDNNQPNPVLDDYQYNVTAARKLQSVDRFFLSGHCACPGTARIEIAFWSPQRSLLATVDAGGSGDFEVSSYAATATDETPVSETRPVAIRVTGRSVVLSSLVIRRLVQYRLRPEDDRNCYPLTIGPGQLFILGDNVPVSIDSRNFGLVSTEDVEGRVIPLSP